MVLKPLPRATMTTKIVLQLCLYIKSICELNFHLETTATVVTVIFGGYSGYFGILCGHLGGTRDINSYSKALQLVQKSHGILTVGILRRQLVYELFKLFPTLE